LEQCSSLLNESWAEGLVESPSTVPGLVARLEGPGIVAWLKARRALACPASDCSRERKGVVGTRSRGILRAGGCTARCSPRRQVEAVHPLNSSDSHADRLSPPPRWGQSRLTDPGRTMRGSWQAAVRREFSGRLEWRSQRGCEEFRLLGRRRPRPRAAVVGERVAEVVHRGTEARRRAGDRSQPVPRVDAVG